MVRNGWKAGIWRVAPLLVRGYVNRRGSLGGDVVKTLRVFDLSDGVLALDLRDLMRLLSPASLAATWTITSPDEPFHATGQGGARLEELAKTDAQVSGSELIALAENTVQVIWGEFIGVLPGDSSQEWVTIRAIDSSFYEIVTSDEEVLEAIETAFNDVRSG